VRPDSELAAPKHSRHASAVGKGKKPGRNIKMTPEVIERICGQIKRGNYAATAYRAVGVSYTTFYKWKELGEADRAAGKRTRYVEFLEALEHAEAVGEQRLVARVIDKGGWKGALEILKRSRPKTWGDKTALTNADGGNLPVPTAGAAGITLIVNSGAPPDDNPWTGEGTDQPEPTEPPESP